MAQTKKEMFLLCMGGFINGPLYHFNPLWAINYEIQAFYETFGLSQTICFKQCFMCQTKFNEHIRAQRHDAKFKTRTVSVKCSVRDMKWETTVFLTCSIRGDEITKYKFY